MADRTVSIVYRISDDGTIRVLDQIEHKVKDVGTAVEQGGDQIARGFSRGQASVVTFNQALQAAQTVANAVRQAINAVTGEIQKLDHIGETAKAVGLTARELSSLRLAAQEGSVPLETLGRAVAFFNRQLVAAADPNSKQAQIFKKLGVDINQDTLPALVQFGKALDTIRDGAVKTDIAKTFFGRGGLEALNVFNSQLADTIELNRKLGAELGSETTAKIGKAADALDRASVAVSSLHEEIAGKLAPGVEAAANVITSLALASQKAVNTDFIGWLSGVTAYAKDLVAVLVPAAGAFAGIARAATIGFGAISNALGAGPTREKITQGTFNAIFPGPQPKSPLEDQLKQLLGGGAASGGGADAANRLAKLTDTSLVDAQKAEQVILQTNVDLFNDELESVRKRIALEGVFAKTQSERLALLDRSESAELEIARQIDAAKGRELDAEIAVLEARKQNRDVVEAASKGLTGQLDLLNAQEDALKVQKQLLTSTSGEAAKVTDAYAKARAEIVAANKVVVNLGDTVESGLSRAVNGILAGGGKFNLKDIISGTGEAIASEFIGGFLKAQLAKDQFDLHVGDNFTVTLPGFMKRGADEISSIWSDLMNSLGLSTGQATDQISQSLTSAVNDIASATQGAQSTVDGLVRSSPALSTAIGSAANVGGYPGDANTGGFTAGDLGGASTIAGGTSAFGAASATSGAGAAAGGLGAAAGALGIAGAFVAAAVFVAQQVAAFRQGFKDAKKLSYQKFGLSATDLSATAFSKDFAGGIWSAILGQKIGGEVNYAALTAGFGPFLDALGVGLFQPKKTGTILKYNLQKLFVQAGLPQQNAIDFQGRSGIRFSQIESAPSEAIQQQLTGLGLPRVGVIDSRANRNILNARIAANPDVEALRTTSSLAAGVLLGRNGGDAGKIANILTNNFLLENITADEADRQLKKLLEQAGLDLDKSLEKINKSFLGHKINEEVAQKAIGDVVKIFSDDLPAGVDAAAIAVKNWSKDSGLAVGAFEKELQRAIEIFGTLQSTVEGGLKTGLDTAAGFYARRDALLAAGGPVNEIIKANLQAKDALSTSLFSAVSDGMRTAIVEGVLDAVKETPAWKALTEAIAAAVKGGDVSNIPDLIKNAVNVSLPVLEAALEGYSKIQSLAAVTPSQLSAEGESLRQQAEGVRYGQLSTRDQQKYLRDKVAKLDAQIASIEAGGVTPDEAATLQKLLEQRGALGQQFIDLAGNYAPDSLQSKQLIQFGLNLLDTTAEQFTEFGISQRNAIESNTTSLDRLTTAIDKNTAAQTKGALPLHVPLGKGDAFPSFSHFERAVANIANNALDYALKQPTTQKQIRSFTRAR